MSMPDARTTILVLHPSSLDPSPYIRRLTEGDVPIHPTKSASATVELEHPIPLSDIADKEHEHEDGDKDEDAQTVRKDVEWIIDNKYYTAKVRFQTSPQEYFDMATAKGVEVVMYLFNGQISSVPPAVVRVMAEPRDIALVIRIPDLPTTCNTEEEEDEEENEGSVPISEPKSEVHREAKDETSPLPLPSDSGPKSKSRLKPTEAESEELEEMFDEVGMEFLDELVPLEEDDERPVPVIERVRQTLMTHMWPNMVRKPLSSSTRGIDDLLSDSDGSEDHEHIDQDRDQDNNNNENDSETGLFPTTFASASRSRLNLEDGGGQVPVVGGPGGTEASGEGEFPGVDELKSQIMLEETERIALGQGQGSGGSGGLSMLERLDLDLDLNEGEGEGEGDGEEDEDDWVQAEYSRLDDWLDEDDDLQAQTQDGDLSEHQHQHDHEPEGEQASHLHLPDNTKDSDSSEVIYGETAIPEESQFEDDFADFAPFHQPPHAHPIAPPSSSSSSSKLPMDPTPLLLHLQNVREELIGLDEDTRRARAGKEVENVFKSLGLGGFDFDETDLDDMEGFDSLLPPEPGAGAGPGR